MKKYLLLICLIFFAASCAKLPSVYHEQQPEFAYDEIVTKSGIKEDAYAVTSNDIKNYVRFKQKK